MPITYNDILEQLKDSPVKLEGTPPSQVHTGLKMVNHYHPWSITEVEFNIIRDRIIEKNYKLGFEVATAFGISALAAGLGFKETGGYLLTMDAYIEEQYNNCGAYAGKKETYYDADGWKSINYIVNKFDLAKAITPVVGWSPDDLYGYLQPLFDSGLRLDYAFIDGGHWQDQILKDAAEVKKYLGEHFSVFFHDGHAFSEEFRHQLSHIIGAEVRCICFMPDCWCLMEASK
jgi:hypothetical protein